MKRISEILIFAALFTCFLPALNAQVFEIRTVENNMGYLSVEMRETSGTGTPSTSTHIVDITFVVRYPAGNVDIALLCSTNDYNIMDGLNGEQTSGDGVYDYHYWNADNTPFNCPDNWVQGQWQEIAVFKVTGATGSGLFEIAPNYWEGRSLNWNQEGTDYTPTPNGDVTYSYPTLVYNYVWKGGSAPPPNFKKWNVAGNWNDECGNTASSYPWGGGNENVYIPSGLTYYPEQTNGGDDYAYICNYLLIESGAHITVPDLSAQTSTYNYFRVVNDAIIRGQILMPALGYTTILGTTKIDGAGGIEVQADATGVGSFIDNGTITYGTSGTAKVQTYLSNSAGSGNFYIHTVGPTLDDENYTGTGSGAFLSAFNINPGNTYAYKWEESVAAGNGWQNIYSLTYEVQSGDGIALSTTDGTNHTLEMTGQLMTGNVSPPALTYSNNHYELISNPYPSSINFDDFATDGSNSGVINNKYWLWDPSAGTYITRASGSGGSEHIQVGQAFFVETVANGTVTFKNSFREHSNDPFRSINPNELTMKVSGGNYGFSDELVVRFVEDATYGYDETLDAHKFASMYDDATQIESVAEDGTKLAINFLPVDGLSGDMVSVPVNFYCGYTAEYTFDFEGIESFENGNEIWLEDKKDNDSWIYLNGNPHYTFTAAPYQPHNRFVLHFFGPTSVNENSVDKPVAIYSYRQYVYIKKNEPNEVIQKVSVYNISGEELFSKRVPDQPVNKLWVSDQVGYYLVKVITDKNTYTGKVFIFK